MKQILIRNGAAVIAEVPQPMIEPDEILVQVRVSCLSIGTEMSGVKLSAVPMWKRALNQPDNVKKVIDMAATYGISQAISTIREKKNLSNPTGYSSSGIVVQIGSSVSDIKVGDRVACAGSPHAELIKVTRNLCVPIPEEVDFDSASTVTLGAIALQGIRRAQPTIGETFVVIGLGVLGQLTVQMLKANGCKTIGLDLDKTRIDLAKELGMNIGLDTNEINDFEQISRFTNGYGADGVIITAASSSNEIISTAFKICRKKGRVVLVGDVGLDLKRPDFYAKELDFFISTSYGPGRYDHRYEEKGLDYPISYVRWTENRNMEEYLRLVANKQVSIRPLVSATYAVENSSEAYSVLNTQKDKYLMVLLTYPVKEVPSFTRVDVTSCKKEFKNEKVRIAVLGAGGFARGTHLPLIKSLNDKYALQAIVTRTGHTAKSVAEQFGAVYASTDYREVLNDPNVDAVIIATRHHLHGQMALEALKAGKHVLLEKPLALTYQDIKNLDLFIKETNEKDLPVLMTGYNRRFSPFAKKMQSLLSVRSAPFIINYRMNAGFISDEHWVHGPEGGGRNVGEACHIYDLFLYLANSKVTELTATSIKPLSNHYRYNDNFVTTLSFENGSIATLTYTALGSKDYSKEMADLYYDGKIVILNDYKSLDVYGKLEKSNITSLQDKGHKNQLTEFYEAIRTGKWPIPWWQQQQSAQIALAVEGQLKQ
jgi:predicted dehydrogenase/threonine dehydrogenase-like Zn-dependent dehydrogenase